MEYKQSVIFLYCFSKYDKNSLCLIARTFDGNTLKIKATSSIYSIKE